MSLFVVKISSRIAMFAFLVHTAIFGYIQLYTMRYVPDIIPAEHKIRPDYFKGGAPVTITENALTKVLYVLGFIFGGLIMMGGLGLLLSGDKLAGALMWLSGFIVFPLGFDIIQRKLSAQIPAWLRFVFVVLLLFFATALVSK